MTIVVHQSANHLAISTHQACIPSRISLGFLDVRKCERGGTP
jgi:hypothetical protein